MERTQAGETPRSRFSLPAPSPAFIIKFSNALMMEPPVNSIKLSQTAKDQLVKLKRTTKIDRWNVLCRWAFFRSLAEAAPPSLVPLPADSNLEMSWQVFGGELADLAILALRQRCYRDGLALTPEIVAQQFRLHLHRGIGYLAGDPSLRKIEHLTALAIDRSGSIEN